MVYNNFSVENISPDQLDEKMELQEDLFILDVRTPEEHARQAIPGSHLIPLQELGHRMRDCRRTKRSSCTAGSGTAAPQRVLFSHGNGFKVKNLEGGIMSWNMAGSASIAKA